MAKNKILKTIHDTMEGAKRAGVVDAKTMREFDALLDAPVKNNPALRRVLSTKSPWEKG